MSSVAESRSRTLLTIFGVLYLLILGDCVSTWLCLTVDSPNHTVTEANPISAWMFGLVGLVPALVLMAVAKAGGMVVLYKLALARSHTYWLIAVGMGIALLMTLGANINNWYALHVITS